MGVAGDGGEASSCCFAKVLSGATPQASPLPVTASLFKKSRRFMVWLSVMELAEPFSFHCDDD